MQRFFYRQQARIAYAVVGLVTIAAIAALLIASSGPSNDEKWCKLPAQQERFANAQ